MVIPVIYSDEFLDHETGSFHPEKPGRLTAIATTLRNSPLAPHLDWQLPTPIADRPIRHEVLRCHTPEYLDTLKAMCDGGGGYVDGDTVVSRRTYEVALLAVSAWLDGVDRVLQTGHPVFVAARPPGHHALSHRGMGFCIFGNAAIAAHYALEKSGINRVAILDWDVHHGNGTQELVWNHPQIAYVSLHQAPFYPGTGRHDETGAHGNVLNVPMKAFGAIADYTAAFEEQVMPFLRNFQPDLLVVSAGFDANRDDPLASMNLLPQDFGFMTHHCLQLTNRVLFGLEGGYDFSSLGASVLAVLRECVAV